MIVSDASLRQLLARGEIVVEPLEDFQIQPASIDLRLGNHFLKIDENSVESITLDKPLAYHGRLAYVDGDTGHLEFFPLS